MKRVKNPSNELAVLGLVAGVSAIGIGLYMILRKPNTSNAQPSSSRTGSSNAQGSPGTGKSIGDVSVERDLNQENILSYKLILGVNGTPMSAGSQFSESDRAAIRNFQNSVLSGVGMYSDISRAHPNIAVTGFLDTETRAALRAYANHLNANGVSIWSVIQERNSNAVFPSARIGNSSGRRVYRITN